MPAQSLNHHTNSSVPASEPAPPPFTSASMAQTMLQITQLLSIGTYLEVEPRRLMIITPIRSTDDTSGCRVCDRASVSLRRWEHLPGCRLTSPAQTHHLLLGIWVIGWRLSKCLTMAGVIDARRCRNFSPPLSSSSSSSLSSTSSKRVQGDPAAKLPVWSRITAVVIYLMMGASAVLWWEEAKRLCSWKFTASCHWQTIQKWLPQKQFPCWCVQDEKKRKKNIRQKGPEPQPEPWQDTLLHEKGGLHQWPSMFDPLFVIYKNF